MIYDMMRDLHWILVALWPIQAEKTVVAVFKILVLNYK